MRNKWWWLNVDFFSVLLISIAVIYCFFTRKRKQHSFRGLGETGFEFNPSKWNVPLRRRKRKKKVYKHEERCREIFERIFRAPFHSIRPNWLKSPASKRNLEIDGFNPNIYTPLGRGLGFEYNGRQHATYTPYYHRGGKKDFHYQVAKDDWKNAKCKELGIMIVNIPHNVAMSDLERFIKYRLKKLGVDPNRQTSYRNTPYKSGRSSGWSSNMYH